MLIFNKYEIQEHLTLFDQTVNSTETNVLETKIFNFSRSFLS